MPVKNKPVQFYYADRRFRFEGRTALKAFLVQLAREEGKELDTVNYIFCSDDFLLQINQEQLNHDTYTDIITFPYSGKGEPLVSDIFISVDRVRENAQTFCVSFAEELCRVIFHGLLHLCGYNDKTKAHQKEMRWREDYWLSRWRSTWNG